MTVTQKIVPPFTEETARAKVQAAEDAWNSRDPERIAPAYTPDSEWHDALITESERRLSRASFQN